MNRLGYRAVNVGERDLVLGYDAFRERTRGAKFPFVSTNVVRKDTGAPVFDPYVVLEVPRAGGAPIRVGVLGAARFNPIFLKAGPDGTNLVIRKPEEAIAQYLPEVRAKSDIVVLLAALHKDDARAIAKAVPGIDLVIGAYGGIYTTRDEREGSTLLLYTGNQGKRIGESRVFLDGAGAIRSTTSFQYFLTGAYPGVQEWVDYANEVLARAGAVGGGADGAPAAHAP